MNQKLCTCLTGQADGMFRIKDHGNLSVKRCYNLPSGRDNAHTFSKGSCCEYLILNLRIRNCCSFHRCIDDILFTLRLGCLFFHNLFHRLFFLRHFLCGIFISEHPGQDECHARRNQEHDNIVQWIIQTKQQSKDTGYSGTGCTQSHNGSIQCSAGTAYCTTDERPEEP